MLSEHFSESEFWCRGQDQGTCNCGHSLYVDPRLIELLEQLRANIGGYPLEISSGYRCYAHNQAINGASSSQHCKGTAADVVIPSQLTREEFLWYIEQLPFDGIGVYSSFTHLDIRNGGVGHGPKESRYFWYGNY